MGHSVADELQRKVDDPVEVGVAHDLRLKLGVADPTAPPFNSRVAKGGAKFEQEALHLDLKHVPGGSIRGLLNARWTAGLIPMEASVIPKDASPEERPKEAVRCAHETP